MSSVDLEGAIVHAFMGGGFTLYVALPGIMAILL